MKVAILANNQPGFIRPMAAGLKKMLDSQGVKAEIFPNGLAILNYRMIKTFEAHMKNAVKSVFNLVRKRQYLLQKNISWFTVEKFEAQLSRFDLIVVVCNLPDAFLAKQLSRIEKIRTQTNIPIVLYQNYYLASRGDWSRQIMDPAIYGGGFGLERYDWYLVASAVSEYPLSNECHPYSLIGHDLRDGSLYAELDKPFRVLLDFKRKGFESFRQLQIQALEETNTEYLQLSDHYDAHEINMLYRQHSAIFLSFRESFGLPVVENQLCGNIIFAAHKNWVSSHYINKSVHVAGEGALGRNFIIYDNELDKLKTLIRECQKNHQPEKVVAYFREDYPALYHGDLVALKAFLYKLSVGEITGDSHLRYAVLNNGIIN